VVDTFGPEQLIEPEPIKVNLEQLIDLYRLGIKQFGPMYREILSEECARELESVRKLSYRKFSLSMYVWVCLLYEMAATFHSWPHNRQKLVEIITPLYYGRIASFIKQTRDMTSFEAEKLVEEQAIEFEENKDYLVSIWDRKKNENKEFTGHMQQT
jgi:hypothetical protein